MESQQWKARITVGYDGSPSSVTTVEWAANEAALRDAGSLPSALLLDFGWPWLGHRLLSCSHLRPKQASAEEGVSSIDAAQAGVATRVSLGLLRRCQAHPETASLTHQSRRT